MFLSASCLSWLSSLPACPVTVIEEVYRLRFMVAAERRLSARPYLHLFVGRGLAFVLQDFTVVSLLVKVLQ